MGTRSSPPTFMGWQADLDGMVKAKTRVKQRCPKCQTWDDVNVIELFCYHGPDFSLVDYHPPCEACGGPMNFHASPGPGTPFRPLFT